MLVFAKWIYGINFELITFLRKFVDRKSQGHRCHISRASVMISLYVKFHVHSSYAKQVGAERGGWISFQDTQLNITSYSSILDFIS